MFFFVSRKNVIFSITGDQLDIKSYMRGRQFDGQYGLIDRKLKFGTQTHQVVIFHLTNFCFNPNQTDKLTYMSFLSHARDRKNQMIIENNLAMTRSEN